MAFYVGQKVARFRFGVRSPLNAPHEIGAHIPIGEVVTIREITRERRRDGEVKVGLRFEEYINPTYHYAIGSFEIDYNSDNFRPLSEPHGDVVNAPRRSV